MVNERWLPIPGYEGIYEASNKGFVRSLDRHQVNSQGVLRRLKGRTLRPSSSPLNCKRVVLYKPEAPAKTMTVHRAVMLAFGPDLTPLIICHSDGDPTNNQLENLRWDTPSSNMYDKQKHGTDHLRNRTHCPNGHPLEQPNLISKKLSKGFRACRSCHQARSDQFNGSHLSYEQSADLRLEMNLRKKSFPHGQRKKFELLYLESNFDATVVGSFPDQKDAGH